MNKPAAHSPYIFFLPHLVRMYIMDVNSIVSYTMITMDLLTTISQAEDPNKRNEQRECTSEINMEKGSLVRENKNTKI